ncbi:MAG: hypothetical protein CMI60_08940 [Parvibaculum sp.]|jgi:hypothetical protein|nr:hypothetical protein [Parvibaculum sp.]
MSSQIGPKSFRLLALSAVLALGGCAFADEVIWPTVAGDEAKTGANAAPALGTSTAAGLTVTPGQATGTPVGARVAQLRGDLGRLQTAMNTRSAELESIRSQTSTHASAYHASKAGIEAKLQVGTTPGNPNLVSAWNQTQAELDQMARDINNMTALSTAIAGDASTATYLLDTIQATFGLSGAVDADHVQLETLQDNTKQTIVVINSLLSELREDTARQTTYLANERAALNTLSNAIKRGQIYGGGLSVSQTPLAAPRLAAAPRAAGEVPGTPPLVTIRFDRPDVEYERSLYTALSQALELRPGAEFTVLSVSPAGGTAANVQLAQSQSRENAERVFRSMSDMGLPPDRVQLSATTSSGVSANEVRIYVR